MTTLYHLAFVFGFLTALTGFVISLAGRFGLVNRGIAITVSPWLMAASIGSLILYLSLRSHIG